jgi:hypothetical protein
VSVAAALRSNTQQQQQQQPQPPSVSQACHASLEANQQVPSQSVQAHNANSSSVRNMFRVVTMIFQQIVTELSGAESEEDRIITITKIVLNAMKQNGR